LRGAQRRGNLPSPDFETTRATKKNGVGRRLAPPIVIPDLIGNPARATEDGFQTAEDAEDAAHHRAATKGNVSADFADLRRFVPSESVESAQSADDLILFLLATYSLSSQKACQENKMLRLCSAEEIHSRYERRITDSETAKYADYAKKEP